MADELDRVIPLDRLDDFEVADGDPDVRGWEVVASDGRRVGEVDELLVDTQAMKVRYLEVDLENDASATVNERHVLIPIGYARLDERDGRVIVDALTSPDLIALPVYARGPLTRDFESELRTRFDTSYTPRTQETDFYAGAGYDQDRFYGSRRARPDLPRDGDADIRGRS